MTFPARKHNAAFATDSDGISERDRRGSAGLEKKDGMGAVNWKRDLKKRYPAMGSQKMGTKYHTVRVAISRISGPNMRAEVER